MARMGITRRHRLTDYGIVKGNIPGQPKKQLRMTIHKGKQRTPLPQYTISKVSFLRNESIQFI